MQYNPDRIKQKLKKILDARRYEHTIGVTYTGIALAMCYGYDIKKAEFAGLLHDCAKSIPDEKKLNECIKYNISITEVERTNPYLLHAKLGAFLAMEKYKIEDKEIINAILNHTTGKPAMSILDKIIYVADYIEPRRDQAPNLDEIRKVAFKDLDLALYMILRDTMDYLENTTAAIDKITASAYEYYKKLYEDRNSFMEGKEQ